MSFEKSLIDWVYPFWATSNREIWARALHLWPKIWGCGWMSWRRRRRHLKEILWNLQPTRLTSPFLCLSSSHSLNINPMFDLCITHGNLFYMLCLLLYSMLPLVWSQPTLGTLRYNTLFPATNNAMAKKTNEEHLLQNFSPINFQERNKLRVLHQG